MARCSFQSAIVYAPNDPIPYQRLADFYAGNGQGELATQFFNTALDVPARLRAGHPGISPACAFVGQSRQRPGAA
jgi:hypothetical protein